MNPKRALSDMSINPGLADGLSECQQLRLTEILDECMSSFEAGRPVDESAIIADHPELAGPLVEYFESIRFLFEASSGIRPHPTQTEHPAPQQVGEYRILREIGRGGMGVVYEAEDSALLRRVALKVLPFAALLDQKQIARFHNEAQAAGQLHHPHIVPVYSVGCDRGVHFFAMQLVEGQPLDVAISELRQASRFPQVDMEQSEIAPAFESTSPWQNFSTSGCHRNREYMRIIAELAADVADGLQHAHEFGILHRDIKPSNLLLDRTGKVWVSDFGLAHLPSDESITMTGDVMGTIRYMSPEQAAGRSRFLDHRTDIYSLGITLYEMATLTRAFDMEHRDEFLACIASLEPKAPRRLNDSIPVDLETIILKAIAKSPEERYETAAAMSADLRRFLAGQPTLAQPPTILDHAAKWTKRNLRLVTMSLLALTVALALTGFAAMKLSRAVSTARKQTELADSRFRLAHSAIEQHMIAAEELNLFPGTSRLRDRLLRDSLVYYKSFIEENSDDPQLQFELGYAFFKAATISEQLGDRKPAREYYDLACGQFKPLSERARASSEASKAMLHLAHSLNNRGLLSWREGDSAAALEDLELALDCHSKIPRESIPQENKETDLASTLVNKSIILAQSGETLQSRRIMARAIQLQRESIRENSDERKVRRLATSLHHMAAQAAAEQPILAEEYCREAITIQQRLVKEYSNRVVHESALALGFNSLGSLCLRRGNSASAMDAFLKSVKLSERVVMREPDVFAYQRDMAMCLNNLGRTQLSMNRAADASATLSLAESHLKNMMRRYGASAGLESTLGGIEFNQGMAMMSLKQIAEAKRFLRSANERQRRAMELAKDGQAYASFLDDQLARTAQAMLAVSDFESAYQATRGRFRSASTDAVLVDTIERICDVIGQARSADFASERVSFWEGEAIDLISVAFEQARDKAKIRELDFSNISANAKFKSLLPAIDTIQEYNHPNDGVTEKN